MIIGDDIRTISQKVALGYVRVIKGYPALEKQPAPRDRLLNQVTIQ